MFNNMYDAYHRVSTLTPDMINQFKNIKNEYKKAIIEKSVIYSKQYGLGDGSSTHNNKSDAFKHAFLSAVTCIKAGDTIGHRICDDHELENLQGNGPLNETIMDLHNNRVGREIARNIIENAKRQGEYHPDRFGNITINKALEDQVADEINKRMKNGEFITSLDDPRIKEYKKNSEVLFEGSSVRELKPEFNKALERERKRKESENNNKQKTGYFNSQSTNAIAFDPSVYENLSYDDRVYYQGDEPTAIWDKDDEDVTKQDELEFKVFNRQLMNDNWKLPTKEELDERVARGELIWVDGYTKQDGTVVKGYFRHYPETA